MVGSRYWSVMLRRLLGLDLLQEERRLFSVSDACRGLGQE